MNRIIVGVDVSKDHLDAAANLSSSPKRRFTNDADGTNPPRN